MTRYIIYLFLITWPIFSWTTLVSFGRGLPDIDVLRPAALFVFLITLTRITINQKIKIDNTVYFCLAYVLIFIVNLLIIEPNKGFLSSAAFASDLYVVPIIIYFALLNFEDNINEKDLVYSILISGIYIAIVGIAEFIVGRNLIGPEGLEAGDLIFRTNGPFYDIIGYSGIVLMYIPFTYYFMKEKIIGKYIGASCLLLFSLGSLVNYSRATMISFLVIFIILIGSSDLKKMIFYFIVIIIMGVTLYFTYDLLIKTRLYTERISEVSTITGRLAQYSLCIKTFMKSPLIGIGDGNFWKAYDYDIHSTYLRVIVEQGLVGFIPFICFIFSIIFKKLNLKMAKISPEFFKTKLSIIFIVLFIPSTINFLRNKQFVLILLLVVFSTNYWFFRKRSQEEKI
ncbi:MAG: O-antigen ligase family protein [Candidatus Hodarchaeota archaeon]